MKSLSSREAASMLFQQYGDEVYRYIRYTTGNASHAEDILQEAFLRVLQSWDRFNHSSTPKTWLWAITKNCIRDYFRSEKRKKEQIPLGDHTLNWTDKDVALKLQLEQIVNSLTLTQREVFVERIIHERSTEETSMTLGWSIPKVKTTLHRAMKEVRRLLEEGGNMR